MISELKFSFMIFILLSSFNTFAIDGIENYQDKILVNSAKCFRKIIEKKIGGIEGYNLVKKLANQLRNNQIISQEALESCTDFLKSNPTLKISKEDYSKIPDYFLDILLPQRKCTNIGVQAGLGMGIDMSVGVGGEICYSENGRKFLAISYNFSVGFGVGAHLNTTKTNQKGLDKFFSSSQSTEEANPIGGFVLYTDSNASSFTDIKLSEIIGVGFGFVAKADQFSYEIKFLPLPSDDKANLTLLKTLRL